MLLLLISISIFFWCFTMIVYFHHCCSLWYCFCFCFCFCFFFVVWLLMWTFSFSHLVTFFPPLFEIESILVTVILLFFSLSLSFELRVESSQTQPTRVEMSGTILFFVITSNRSWWSKNILFGNICAKRKISNVYITLSLFIAVPLLFMLFVS